jgi:hypothetical protein
MSTEILTTYLNDHLAGSVAAIELIEHLAEVSKGTEREKFFARIGADVKEDQEVIKQLLGDLGGKESKTRKAAAWLTEKVGQAKLQLDDPGTRQLRLLEALETLGLGIQGKLALWRTLGVAAERISQLRKLDLTGLARRASDQHDRVEAQRLQVARSALGTTG